MPYDRKHVLCTWGGTLPGGEQWTCGLRLASGVSEAGLAPLPLGISDSFLSDLLGSYVPAIKTFHTTAATGINSACKLTYVKAAAIGVDGKYLPDQTSVARSDFAPLAGGHTAQTPPNQVALCVTTKTARLRGHAHQGRFFLPLVSIDVSNVDGLMSAGNAAGVAAQAKILIEALSDIPGVDIITSPGAAVMSKIGSGATNRITGVAVGRVLDTQRRRRRSLPESRVSAVVDQGAF
jgi:hypothetical protein